VWKANLRNLRIIDDHLNVSQSRDLTRAVHTKSR
jgi:hypothetical protein